MLSFFRATLWSLKWDSWEAEAVMGFNPCESNSVIIVLRHIIYFPHYSRLVKSFGINEIILHYGLASPMCV